MKSNVILFVVLAVAACLTQFATDVYAPSLPAISLDLGASIETVQWSLAVYMLGVALSQIIYGPLSEGIGRKASILTGLIIMLAGSGVCVWSQTIEGIIWGRFIQGCGAGACAALWRSVFRDKFSGTDLAKNSSYLVILIMFFIPAAPVFGGFLEETFGWRSNFKVMVGVGIVVIGLFSIGFKETNQHTNLSRLKISYILRTYKRLLLSPVFVGISLAVFFSYGACFVWFTVGPILLIKILGISPIQFGLVNFIAAIVGYGVAGGLNGRLVCKLGVATMLRMGWGLMILAAIVLSFVYLKYGLTTWGLMGPVTLMYFGSSFIWPNAFSSAFTPFGDIAGYAGALYGSFQVGGAAALGGISAWLPDTNPLIFSSIILISSLMAWGIYEKFVHQSSDDKSTLK